MEAENFHNNDTRSTDANWSELTTNTGYVGSYMEAPSNSSGNTDWTTGAELGYDIDFTTAGTYTIWLRVYCDHSGTDSVFVGLDGTQIGYN